VGQAEWRAYSVASATDDTITLLIDLRPAGEGVTYVKDLVLGEKSLFRLPIHDLVYHQSERDPVFIASGTGLVPFLHMLDELKKSGCKKNPTVIFGCLTDKDDISKEYLAAYETFFKFKTIVCVDNLLEDSKNFGGRITDYLIKNSFNTKIYDFYVCGHPNMTDAVIKLLRSQGADKVYY
jgi:NAD(P)H-flavin reductase